MATINIAVMHVWQLRGTTGDALTGLSGNMTATLTRYPTTTTSESATETVAIAEIGSTGDYTLIYTPTKAYRYKLYVTESSLYLEEQWDDNVADAPSTSVADNAYCTEADVVAWAQAASDYTASTIPTETQVLGFMEMRAGEIYSVLTSVMGASAVGPSGATNYATEIDTTSDIGFALGRQLKMANAIGAAADALEAAGQSEAPARSERVSELLASYSFMLWGNPEANIKSPVMLLATQYLDLSENYSLTHVSAGEITNPTVTSRERESLSFDESTEW